MLRALRSKVDGYKSSNTHYHSYDLPCHPQPNHRMCHYSETIHSGPWLIPPSLIRFISTVILASSPFHSPLDIHTFPWYKYSYIQPGKPHQSYSFSHTLYYYHLPHTGQLEVVLCDHSQPYWVDQIRAQSWRWTISGLSSKAESIISG